ncbi:hypothetical protein SNEBB_000730 [Seison nebaliae]|nr:hypothetical protein SNEBB_000730 [Seison nebaliae]
MGKYRFFHFQHVCRLLMFIITPILGVSFVDDVSEILNVNTIDDYHSCLGDLSIDTSTSNVASTTFLVKYRMIWKEKGHDARLFCSVCIHPLYPLREHELKWIAITSQGVEYIEENDNRFVKMSNVLFIKKDFRENSYFICLHNDKVTTSFLLYNSESHIIPLFYSMKGHHFFQLSQTKRWHKKFINYVKSGSTMQMERHLMNLNFRLGTLFEGWSSCQVPIWSATSSHTQQQLIGRCVFRILPTLASKIRYGLGNGSDSFFNNFLLSGELPCRVLLEDGEDTSVNRIALHRVIYSHSHIEMRQCKEDDHHHLNENIEEINLSGERKFVAEVKVGKHLQKVYVHQHDYHEFLCPLPYVFNPDNDVILWTYNRLKCSDENDNQKCLIDRLNAKIVQSNITMKQFHSENRLYLLNLTANDEGIYSCYLLHKRPKLLLKLPKRRWKRLVKVKYSKIFENTERIAIEHGNYFLYENNRMATYKLIVLNDETMQRTNLILIFASLFTFIIALILFVLFIICLIKRR